MHHDHQQGQSTERNPSLGNWAFWAFLAIAALFLLSEHRVHVLGWLPWLILLACPLLHFFMHRGQGGGHGHD